MKNIVIISLALALLAACGDNKNTKVETEAAPSGNAVELTDDQMKNSEIQTGKIERKTISSLLRVNGKIDVPPQNMVSISVPLGGYLKSSHLLEGTHVRRGEVIAIMEDQQYIQLQQDYLTAKAQFGALEKEYLRQKQLNESKATSDKVFENAQSDYLSQKILISALSEKLKLIGINLDKLDENSISRSINVYSPIDGFVSKINMNIGKYASPTEVLFELVNPADIHLALTVFEKDLDKLFVGQKVVAYTNHQPSKKFNAEIILISNDVSPEGTVTLHCHFDQYDKSLVPGMYMNADIEASTHNALVIPNEGIVRFEGKQYVFTKTTANEYEMEEVTLQNSANGYTQITLADTMGLQDRVFVTKGAYTLLMKMKNTEE